MEIQWERNDKVQFVPNEVPGTEKVHHAQLVLLAMGFDVTPRLPEEHEVVLFVLRCCWDRKSARAGEPRDAAADEDDATRRAHVDHYATRKNRPARRRLEERSGEARNHVGVLHPLGTAGGVVCRSEQLDRAGNDSRDKGR